MQDLGMVQQPYFITALKRSGLSLRDAEDKKVVLGREILNAAPGAIMRSFPKNLLAADLAIRYSASHSLVSFDGRSLEKPLIHFDFREEWNNLGYGAIPLDEENIFSLSGAIELKGADVFAEVIDLRSGEKICDYAAVIDQNQNSTLWFNRAVGPIDGYDWVIVENFYSTYRRSDLTCSPVISEIPEGYSSAFTMRIDCDEAVASGRALFELYAAQKVPFAMAIKTAQALGEGDRQLMADVLSENGSVVSHSHTHAPNWGGSRESAAWEINESHRVLREFGLPGISYDYAVSPFHQNPISAVQGLRDAGIRGFVGGIICNDPEFLFARAGAVPGVDGIISHSQQCMLHGESVIGGSLSIYEQAFTQSLQTRKFFGFLDHPFSQYWYGWKNEEDRLAKHQLYLEFILSHKDVWRASLVDAMRFLDMKAQVQVTRTAESWRLSLPADVRWAKLPPLKIERAGESHSLRPGDEVVIEA
jgi:hypothetical protein